MLTKDQRQQHLKLSHIWYKQLHSNASQAA